MTTLTKSEPEWLSMLDRELRLLRFGDFKERCSNPRIAADIFDHIRWEGAGPRCPSCLSYANTEASPTRPYNYNQYACNSCGHDYTAVSGTALEGTTLSALQWLKAINLARYLTPVKKQFRTELVIADDRRIDKIIGHLRNVLPRPVADLSVKDATYILLSVPNVRRASKKFVRESIATYLKKVPDLSASVALLESIRWPDEVWCPWCESKKSTRIGDEGDDGFHPYLCADCNTKFDVVSNTVFEGPRRSLDTWFKLVHIRSIGNVPIAEMARAVQLPLPVVRVMERRITVAMRYRYPIGFDECISKLLAAGPFDSTREREDDLKLLDSAFEGVGTDEAVVEDEQVDAAVDVVNAMEIAIEDLLSTPVVKLGQIPLDSLLNDAEACEVFNMARWNGFAPWCGKCGSFSVEIDRPVKFCTMRYKCSDCRTMFTARGGTEIGTSRITCLRWIQMICLYFAPHLDLDEKAIAARTQVDPRGVATSVKKFEAIRKRWGDVSTLDLLTTVRGLMDMKAIRRRSPSQIVEDVADAFPTEDDARTYFVSLRWGGKVSCPSCYEDTPVREQGQLKKGATHHCMGVHKGCGTKFNVASGSLISYPSIPYRKWIGLLRIMETWPEMRDFEVARWLAVDIHDARAMIGQVRKAMPGSLLSPLEDAFRILLTHKDRLAAMNHGQVTESPSEGVEEDSSSAIANVVQPDHQPAVEEPMPAPDEEADQQPAAEEPMPTSAEEPDQQPVVEELMPTPDEQPDQQPAVEEPMPAPDEQPDHQPAEEELMPTSAAPDEQPDHQPAEEELMPTSAEEAEQPDHQPAEEHYFIPAGEVRIPHGVPLTLNGTLWVEVGYILEEVWNRAYINNPRGQPLCISCYGDDVHAVGCWVGIVERWMANRGLSSGDVNPSTVGDSDVAEAILVARQVSRMAYRHHGESLYSCVYCNALCEAPKMNALHRRDCWVMEVERWLSVRAVGAWFYGEV